ncbi:MAG: L,D-transpeptidase family protein [Acidobacteria bacterium]|nr:L,D-transpeptidase family protein [Acidobacteriota bacterium]
MRIRRLISVLSTCGLLACADASTSSSPAAPVPQADRPPLQISAEGRGAAFRAVLGEGDAALGIRTVVERRQLESLYGVAEPAFLWVDETGQPSQAAREALAWLADAASEGLDPDDYAAPEIERVARGHEGEGVPEVTMLARFDARLSLGLLRYWRDLHLGRVDPRAVGFRMNAPTDDHDFAAMLREALVANRLGGATEELRPPLALYRGLVAALAMYRRLAAADAHPLTLAVPRVSVKPGAPFDAVGPLVERLRLLGDLPAEAPAPVDTAVYDGAVVEGVKRFQARHGLEPDGVLGRSTVAALNVPLDQRVAQLELALERLRWLPHLRADGFLAVNIPMFRLWGWGAVPPDGMPAFDMAVIVGKALNTQTPVFVEEMRHIIFRPYWNVPRSILRGEVLPAMARDPKYLARNDMEIVAGESDEARRVAADEEGVAGLRDGRYRVRQRPGPKNSLGLVKFVFPNDENVYMHGTPAVSLFGRPRRDFSHGCIRVEDPVKLAEWMLRDQPEWTRERILEAMNGDRSVQVKLTRPVQVVLFYLTAVAMPGTGDVRFADDIYGHDRRLARALADR